MNLTKQILHIMLSMRKGFLQARSYGKFLLLVFATLCTAGRHTITSFIHFLKQDNEDWAKIYRFFSKVKWNPEICFDELTRIAVAEALKRGDDIVVALDDFKVRKTGKTIPHTRYQLDTKSPAFQRGLMWGHRYLHAVLLIVSKKNGKKCAAKAISIRIKLAPHVKKPGKKATEEDWKEYRSQKKDYNVCEQANKLITELRSLMDKLGHEDRRLMIVADGGYCNKTIFRDLPDRVDLNLRCRKDARLCHRLRGRKFYDSHTFTPHEIYKDDNIEMKKCRLFYGRRITEVKYKEKTEIYWQRGAQKRALRCIVVFGVKYRRKKSGYTNIREPMFLLTTDQTSSTRDLIQNYFYRWEIEVTHRELKNNLGMSEAQVWNEVSVERCPKLVVLANSIIHLGHLLNGEEDGYLEGPKWYKKRHRVSLEYLRRRLRNEIVDEGLLEDIIGTKWSWKDIFERIAA